jgi:lipoprotein-releasing system permease protein
LNTELFIARKIIKKHQSKDKVSKPIVKISLASITIGIAVMLITVSIVTGFQEKIREKVIGFGSHIQISQLNDNSSMESMPILIDQPFVEDIKAEPKVKTIQNYAYKPAILQTDLDTNHFTVNGKDSIIINRDIAGVLFKGIDSSYDWSFFEDKLTSGELIDKNSNTNEILISEYIANLLHYKIGDKVNAYFIQNSNPKKRSFNIKGIYRTGLEDFDKKIIFSHIGVIQKINNWGVETKIKLLDTCVNNQFVLEAMAYSYTNRFIYDWDDGYNSSRYKLFTPNKNETIDLKVNMIDANFYGENTVNDSLFSSASANIIIDKPCDCELSLFDQNPIEYISETEIKTPFGKIEYQFDEGTSNLYTGGFEVIINNWDDLEDMDKIIYEHIPFKLQTQKITDLNPEIFSWLDFLDMNIAIILTLMIIVSLINMTTSLLVLILEKTNMIGILKAVGSTNWSIRKIFLYNSFYLLSRGLFLGNLIGIGLLLIQKFTNAIPLDPKIYYLDTVPVSINFTHILAINLLTIVICMIVLIIPSYLVSKIQVVKAVKFD